jgi:putative redox protein
MASATTATPAEVTPVIVTETGGGGYQVEVRVGANSFLADEPEAVGGLGSGPNPYELLSAALGTCTVLTTRLYANRKGWPLTRVSARVARVAPAVGGRDLFERVLILQGDLDEGQRARLLDIASRCPVSRTLERGSDVTISAATGEAALPSD